jgi:hypothetical protein
MRHPDRSKAARGHTERLRARIAALACLPALAAGVACHEPPPTAASRAGTPAKKAPAETKSPQAEAKAPLDRREAVIVDPGQPELDPEEARFAPIAGDPPYVDGYNPEEETCPSGNWCGTIATATPLAANPHVPTTLDCPDRIIGAHNPSPIQGPAYQGLSSAGTMQGAINRDKTEKERAKGTQDACCYHWFEYCSGRPLREDEAHLVAEVRSGDDWSASLRPCADALDEATRRALAQAWLADALAEHASVAAFARVTLELMAHGAPPELLAETQRAALDEIEHARRCFALAGRYGGSAVAPGPIATPPPRTGDLARLAVDTFVEGCVGETIAALVAERALARATDPEVRTTLTRIADDEARHAALAWRTLAWAIERGGEDVRHALRRAEGQLVAATPGDPAQDQNETQLDSTAWAEHGRLESAVLEAAADDAMTEIVGPMLARLLAPSPGARITSASSA